MVESNQILLELVSSNILKNITERRLNDDNILSEARSLRPIYLVEARMVIQLSVLPFQ